MRYLLTNNGVKSCLGCKALMLRDKCLIPGYIYTKVYM